MLLPTLAFWMAAIGDLAALRFLAGFRERHLSHSTLQLWLPHDDSEAHLYLNDDQHGSAYTDIRVTAEPDALLNYVLAECRPETPCQSACNWDPRSACKRDPYQRLHWTVTRGS